MTRRVVLQCAVVLVASGCGSRTSDGRGQGSETGGSEDVELPGCGAGQSRFVSSFVPTDLSPGAPTEGEPFEPLLGLELQVLVCVDASTDIDPEPLAVGFQTDGTIEFFGRGADALGAEIVDSFAAVSIIDWQVHYRAPDEPSIVNFNVWGRDELPLWLMHVSCSEFEGPQIVGGEIELAPISCPLAGGRLTRSDADGSHWAEGLGSFELEP